MSLRRNFVVAAARFDYKTDNFAVVYSSADSLWTSTTILSSSGRGDSATRTRASSYQKHFCFRHQNRTFTSSITAKMQENVAKLYPNPETSAKVMDYSIAHSTPLPDYLIKYHKWGCEETKVPSFLISTYQAQMLIFLARIVGVKRVLELGVYIGFSAMVWSEAIGPDGQVVGLELSEEYAAIARKAFADNNVHNVDIKLGDGAASLEALEPAEPFDLIFVDANKDAYPKYLELILSKSQPGSEKRLLKKGGLIVADNVLRRGIVADATEGNPHFAREKELHGEQASKDLVKALHVFNDALAREQRLETFLMPMFDGLGMARLKD